MANQLFEMLDAITKSADVQRSLEADPEEFLKQWELTDEQQMNLIRAYRNSDRELWEQTVAREWCKLIIQRRGKGEECFWC